VIRMLANQALNLSKPAGACENLDMAAQCGHSAVASVREVGFAS